MPIVCRVSEAGWRPVNRLATATGEGLVCEQFGERLLTLFNHGKATATAEVAFKAPVIAAKDLVSGADVPVADGCAQVEIGPGEVAVWEIKN